MEKAAAEHCEDEVNGGDYAENERLQKECSDGNDELLEMMNERYKWAYTEVELD